MLIVQGLVRKCVLSGIGVVISEWLELWFHVERAAAAVRLATSRFIVRALNGLCITIMGKVPIFATVLALWLLAWCRCGHARLLTSHATHPTIVCVPAMHAISLALHIQLIKQSHPLITGQIFSNKIRICCVCRRAIELALNNCIQS